MYQAGSLSFEAKYKSKLLDTLRFAISFFDEYGLNWFVASGSCLGAIRHQGMIPWDDDIDVFMPRSDYEKLLDLKPKMIGSGFDVVSLRDDGYYTNFGKIINSSTTIWERKEWPFVIGVYIDIFPLDRTELTTGEFTKKYKKYYNSLKKYRRSITSFSYYSVVSLFREHHYYSAFTRLLDPFFHPFKSLFYKSLLHNEHIFDKPHGSQLITPFWMYGLRELYQSKWFDDYCLMPFEDMLVRVPIGYHEYLKYVYGDYMIPPPIEKRNAHHQDYFTYINLTQHLDITEVQKRVQAGEKIIY